jgi:type IV pilus assembly protein PilQ
MTVLNAKILRPARRPLPMRATLFGLTAGLLAAGGGVSAAQPAMQTHAMSTAPYAAPVSNMDPGKQIPGAISVSNIDFKRGDAGAGRLILHFSGEGASPDLHNQGSSVIVTVGNAHLPAALQKPLNVTDFATPVQRVDANSTGTGTQIVLSTSGPFESRAYQTGRDYIVEILPRAAIPVAQASASSNPAMGATVSSSTTRAYSGKPVTFNFQDVPVRTVLQLIAEESNLNLVASDTVQGNVTLRLVNVPWDQALDIVLQAKGLDKRRSGNVVWVAPQSEIAKYEQDKEDARIAIENRAEMVTEYVPISYGNAEDIAKLLTDEAKGSTGGGGGAGGVAGVQSRGFLSPRGSISFDRRTNTLLIIDIPQRVAAIKDLVRLLDKPVDQVVIEARIVIANESFARELGAKFGISGSKNNTYFSGDLATNAANRQSQYTTNQANQTAQNAYDAALAAHLANPSTPVPARPVFGLPSITRGLMSNFPAATSAGSLALSILNAGYLLDVELSALQTEGRGEVISNPRIVTSNQKEAVIRQGQEVPYLTITGGTGGSSIPQVQFKEALLELKVTPTITNDGRVFLNMNVKKDEVSGFTDTGFGQVPNIAKREVNTAVLMEDGQTVVIGGVYEFNNRQDMSKIPFLADIPVIGNLFKKNSRTKTKAELLIFVTPKVLRVSQR